MQFFIALAVLLVASSAYLLHQFWSRTLSIDPPPLEAGATAPDEARPSHLKAA